MDAHLRGAVADDAHRDRALAGAARNLEPVVRLRATWPKLIRRLHGSPAHVPDMPQSAVELTWESTLCSPEARHCAAVRPGDTRQKRLFGDGFRISDARLPQLVAILQLSVMHRPAVHCRLRKAVAHAAQEPVCTPTGPLQDLPAPCSPTLITQRERTCTCRAPA